MNIEPLPLNAASEAAKTSKDGKADKPAAPAKPAPFTRKKFETGYDRPNLGTKLSPWYGPLVVHSADLASQAEITAAWEYFKEVAEICSGFGLRHMRTKRDGIYPWVSLKAKGKRYYRGVVSYPIWVRGAAFMVTGEYVTSGPNASVVWRHCRERVHEALHYFLAFREYARELGYTTANRPRVATLHKGLQEATSRTLTDAELDDIESRYEMLAALDSIGRAVSIPEQLAKSYDPEAMDEWRAQEEAKRQETRRLTGGQYAWIEDAKRR